MGFRIFTVLAVIALGVSTWFLSSPGRRLGDNGSGALDQLPGYYLKNAVLSDFDPDGNVSLRLHADRIDQVDHSQEVALYNVRVDYQSPQGQAWVLLGDTGRVEAGGKIIDAARKTAANCLKSFILVKQWPVSTRACNTTGYHYKSPVGHGLFVTVAYHSCLSNEMFDA